jgi:hypothetical protein
LREAGFTVRGVEDVTANATAVASRWYQARDRHREALVAGEGDIAGCRRQPFIVLCRYRETGRRQDPRKNQSERLATRSRMRICLF